MNAEPRDSSVVECHDLKKRYAARYGDIMAVDGITLQIMGGSCFGLLGPNGAGKTTLVEMLVGITPPTSGTFRVLGTSVAAVYRDRVGVSLQHMALPPKLTATETLRLFASFYPEPLDVRCTLDRLGLRAQARQRVRTLSGGQHQRLAVACALIGDPDLMFLDEPTAGVDPASRRQIWEALQPTAERRRTIIISTHSMEEAAQLCDQVAILRAGKVIATGRPGELVSHWLEHRRIRFRVDPEADVDLDALGKLPHVIEAVQSETDICLSVSDAAAAMEGLIHWMDARSGRLVDLHIEQGSLEDVFLRILDRDDVTA
jgi:ABC-2 type transport system ATP-binding protein